MIGNFPRFEIDYRSGCISRRNLKIMASKYKPGAILDKLSYQALLAIINDIMSQFVPEPGDDLRWSMWLDVGSYNQGWCHMTVGVKGEMHYLILDVDGKEHYEFQDTTDPDTPRSALLKKSSKSTDNPPVETIRQSLIFLHLKEYLERLSDLIRVDVDAYNLYIHSHLNPYLRNGVILRRELNRLIPDKSIAQNWREKGVEILQERWIPDTFFGMTLAQYMRTWRVAYESLYGSNITEIDEQVFRHNIGNDDMIGLSTISMKDFEQWTKRVSDKHGYDLIYDKLRLTPVFPKPGVVYLKLDGTLDIIEDIVKVAAAFHSLRIRVEISNQPVIFGILNQSDYVGITPTGEPYRGAQTVTNTLRIPDKNTMSNPIWRAFVKATRWDSPFQIELI